MKNKTISKRGVRSRRFPCGTERAYRAHIRRGEPTDRLCKDAHNEHQRNSVPAVPAVSDPLLCVCAWCCCDRGGEHCRQSGCQLCLDQVLLLGQEASS